MALYGGVVLLPLKQNKPPLLQPSPSSVAALLFTPDFYRLRHSGRISISTKPFRSFSRTRMAAAGSSRDDDLPQIGVLFVCLGNICRSPTAEAVFRYAVEKKGLKSRFNIDSAGTINYHEGEPADARMRAAANKRGVKLTSISRPIRQSDFEEFDIILAMDKKNKEDILKAHEQWSTKQALPPNSEKKVKLMCEYCKKFDMTEVPDPYYGGPAGFEKVLDLLEDACESLLESLISSVANNIYKEI